MSLPQPAIALQQVSRWFDSENGRIVVIDRVEWTIVEHSFTILMAPSGAGKTVLLRIMAGLDMPSQGLIKRSPDGSKIAMVFQGGVNLPWLTVSGNIGFTSAVLGLKMQKETIKSIAREVGLECSLNAFPYQLSGGMNQRLALARAIASNASTLLLDEPFSALDSDSRRDLFELLKRVWKQHKLTIIMTSHDSTDAIDLATSVVLASGNPLQIQEITEKLRAN